MLQSSICTIITIIFIRTRIGVITNKITYSYNYNIKNTIHSYLNMSNYTILKTLLNNTFSLQEKQTTGNLASYLISRQKQTKSGG